MNTEIKRKLFHAQEAERAAKEVLKKAQDEVEAAKSDIRENPGVALTVSEHALLKFMEDVLDMDLQKYRTQMLNLCDRATDVDEQNRADGHQTVYRTEGPKEKEVVMVVRTNNIVTTYSNNNKGRPGTPE